MVPLILALKGKGGSGKSTTIRLLRELLIDRGYSSFETYCNPETYDFVDILSNGTHTIGLTSSGDTYDILDRMLNILSPHQPDIIIAPVAQKKSYKVKELMEYYINTATR
jgi:hypothetical protein